MFRIFPIVIIMLSTMIGVKVLDFLEVIPDLFVVKYINASDKEEPKKEEIKKEEPKKEESKGEHEKEGSKPEEHKGEDRKSDEGKKEGEAEKQMNFSTEKPQEAPQTLQTYSPAELTLLKDLSKRREVLDQRESEIVLKENSAHVIETNIATKIDTLKKLQEELKDILLQYESKENEKIKSLVKVYEAMKPADAAKIFEQLQMSILIEVSVKMKEVKLAQILAKMDPIKAKELTMELANRKKSKEVE